MRKRIDHWFQKNPNPRVHRSVTETLQASFATGTVGPQVRIFLSPLNTNDGFYLSYTPVPAGVEKITKNEQPHVGRTLAARRSVTSL